MQVNQFPLITTLSGDDVFLVQTNSDGAYCSIKFSDLQTLLGSSSSSSGGDTGVSGGSGSSGSSNSSQVVSTLFHGNNNTTLFKNLIGNVDFQTTGSPIISTANSEFTGSNLYLDGNSSLYLPLTTDLTFADGDLSFSAYFYCTGDVLNANNMAIVGNAFGGVGGNAGLFLCINQGHLTFRHWVNGSSSAVHPTQLSPNTWYFGACSKIGTTLKVFLNGIEGNDGSTTQSNYDSQFNIGAVPANSGFATNFKGFINYVDAYKNFAAYTVNFTPPYSI